MLTAFLSLPFTRFSQAAVYAQSAERVQGVAIHIKASPPAAPSVLKRMEASARTVAERLLVGRTVEEVSGDTLNFERLIQDVLDRVLLGYMVKHVTIEPGAVPVVTIILDTWGDVVRDVAVDVEVSAVDPLFIPLLKKDLGNIEKDVTGVLLGLPVDSMNWADTVAKALLRSLIAERLPEFRAAIDIIPGEKTAVKLVLSPLGSVVRESSLSLRSNSMPNILLYDMRLQLEALTKKMRGLPVAWVERHTPYFVDQLNKKAAAHPYSQAYELSVRTEMYPGSDTIVGMHADSRKYKVTAEGNLDLGRIYDNTSGKLHAGKYFSPQDEAFVEVSLITNSMTWKFSPGWARNIGSGTTIGLRYNINDSIRYGWFEQRIGSNWTLRGEVASAKDENEIALRYKLHEYLSAELIHSRKENYVRLTGHL